MVPARELVDLNYGKALVKGSRNVGNVPVYGTNGRCGWHDLPLAPGPSVILGRKGMGPLGVEWSSKPFWVIDTAYYVSSRTEELNLKYFYYVVKYIGLNHLKDGTSNPSLSRDTFGFQLLPFPPPDEQCRIAEILDAFDDKIEMNSRMNETLEAIARALFNWWFMSGSTGSETVVEKLVEIDPSESLPKGTQVTWVEMKDVPTSGPSIMGWVEREFRGGSKFRNEDTLLSRITPCLENGKTAFVDILEDGELGAGSTEFIVLRGRAVPSQWVYCLARDERFRDFAIQQMTGSSGRQRVPNREIAGFTIPSPRREDLTSFDRVTRPLFEMISSNRKQTQVLAQARDALLPRLLSGEIRVGAAEREVAKAV